MIYFLSILPNFLLLLSAKWKALLGDLKCSLITLYVRDRDMLYLIFNLSYYYLDLK